MSIKKLKRNMIGYKKVYVWKKGRAFRGKRDLARSLIAVLRITKGTRTRIKDFNKHGKRRAECAKVLWIETLRGKKVEDRVAYAGFSTSFEYRVGRIVRPTRGFSTRDTACASGIHFFCYKRGAIKW